MLKQYTHNTRLRGEWLVCDRCKLHKEGVQIRKKHCKDRWVCNDCYAKQVKRDACWLEHLGETRPQWKRRKRERKLCHQIN